ncbi:MAG TPA: hypothetical protein VJA40_00080, partial [archaeon]|nr:hypothetical protein [archaeon]
FTVLVDADSTIAGGTYTGSVAVNGTNAATGLAEQTTISVTVVVTTTSSSCNLTAGTYSDLLCVVPNNTFIQGATLYVKAKTDNCTITDGVITLKRPSGSTTSASGLTVDSIAGVCEDFLLATNDETGTWSAQASSVSGAANAAQSSFSVEDDCNLVVSTHSDSLCAVSDASFTENDNVYVKVTITVGCTATDVDVDVREPDNDSARQWNNQTISVVAPFCDNYKIKQNDPLGTWSAAATSDQAADQSSTFSVT